MTTAVQTTTISRAWPLPGTQIPGAQLTWAQWVDYQARQSARQQHYADLPFNDRELALLTLLRSLYQTERAMS
jgi:hypothetical protein